MDMKYRSCSVTVGEDTVQVWIPFRRARLRYPIHVKKEGVVLPQVQDKPWNPDDWDLGVINSVGEAALASTLTDEQKSQVFEE